MVQKNLTVLGLGGQGQHRLPMSAGYRQASTPMRPIAQGLQPVTTEIRQPAAHEGTLPLVQSARSRAVIVPAGYQCQHPSREPAMDRQVGTQDTVPILDGT